MSNSYTYLAGSAGNHKPRKLSVVLHHVHINLTTLEVKKIICCRYRRCEKVYIT